jgi:thiol-disulfide isomerase/thioredoxin
MGHLCFAQNAFSVVRGTINPSFNGQVKLIQQVRGKMTIYKATITPSSGAFAFAVPLVLNDWERLVVIRDNGRHSKNMLETLVSQPVYLKPGETSSFEINLAGPGTIVSLKNASAENVVLMKWGTISPALHARPDVDVNVFVQQYRNMKPRVDRFIQGIQVSGNPLFNRTMKAWAQAEYDFAPLAYASEAKLDGASSGLLKPLIAAACGRLEKLDNGAIAEGDYEYCRQLVRFYEGWIAQRLKVPEGRYDSGMLNDMQKRIDLIRNDTLKGIYLAEKIRNISWKSQDGFVRSMEPFMRYMKGTQASGVYQDKWTQLGRQKGLGEHDETVVADLPIDDSSIRANPDLAYISGTSEEIAPFQGDISISTAAGNGGAIDVVSIPMIDRHFYVMVPVQKEGFYQLKCWGFTGRVYLKPGDRLKLSISRARVAIGDKGQTTSVYRVEEGSSENRLVQDWYDLSLPLTTKGHYKDLYERDSSGPRVYADNYGRVVAAAADFKTRVHSGNSRFDEAMKLLVDADLAAAPLEYWKEFSGKKTGGTNIFAGGLIELPVSVFSHAGILRLQGAAGWVDLYAQAKLATLPTDQRKKMTDAERLAFFVNAPDNDTLKACLLAMKLHSTEGLGVDNLSEFQAVVEPLKKYSVFNPEAKDAYNAMFGLFAGDTAIIGHPVRDIVLHDLGGQEVHMNGYKGKVVLIDAWATWCGPCKAQIPFLKEIEEEYAGNPNVVFVGLSVDREQDSAKWKSMVKQFDLKGVQLIDYSAHDFARPYGIMAVPRFMLLDRNGVWIEIRCPLPEDKQKFKTYIDKALAS